MKPRRDELGLDEIDRRILGLLQIDCKLPLAKIGEKVGLSAPSIVERVRKLESEGFITGYHAHLDARRLGMDITAFIGVSVVHPKSISFFETQLAHLPDVLECHHVTGGYTLLLKVKTRWTYGNLELAATRPELNENDQNKHEGALKHLIRRPWLWVNVPAFLFVYVYAHRAAKKRFANKQSVWERDGSTRPAGKAATPPAQRVA